MPAAPRISEFRELVKAKENVFPDPRRRKRTKRASADGQREGDELLNKQYISDAYSVLNHINSLTRIISSIRKAYLNVDPRHAPLSRQSPRTIDLGSSDQSWSNIKYLTDAERDQIDLQARVVLSRCSERVKELEVVEKRRVEMVASRKNPLTRLLPARLRQDDSSAASDFIAAHHSSITWYLSRRLADTSQSLREMQEERMKRQMDRTRTLGSGATRELMHMDMSSSRPSPTESSGSGSWLGGASNLASSFAASIGSNDAFGSTATIRQGTSSIPEDVLDDTDEEELELTQSQIMQFETENATILQSVQDTLASVQQAESRLLEISALQAELVTQLTRQTEQTEQLYEDAIATASTVEKGNVQLKEARRRARDSRKWILLFLIGASLSLLFLHYY